MPQKIQPRFLRRFLQFRLQTLLLLMTLFAIGGGAYRNCIAPYERQHEAAKALARRGARLTWEPLQPAWLQRVLGWFGDEAVLRECVIVEAQHRGWKDEDLQHLRHMPYVERLYLAGNPITDRGLEHLRGLPRVARLSLWGTKISDEGLRHVGILPALQALDIHDPRGPFRLGVHDPRGPLPMAAPSSKSPINSVPPGQGDGRLTGHCLTHLRQARELRELHLSFALDDESLGALAEMPKIRVRSLILRDVTDVGFRHLARFVSLENLRVEQGSLGPNELQTLGRLPNLRRLRLDHIQADGADWGHLAQLTRLEDLTLAHSTISDTDLKHAGRLKQLVNLTLHAPEITDRGIEHLAGLTNLQHLDLIFTSVTADSVRHLVAMRRLKSLMFPAPLDDEALGCLVRLPSLTQVARGGWNPRITCYVTDAGLADLAKLRCLPDIVLSDARDGTKLPGIDVPDSADTMTDAGLAQLWKKKNLNSVWLSGRDITSAGLRWSPELLQGAGVTIQSPRPAAMFLRGPLDVGEAKLDLHSNGLSLTAENDRTTEKLGPRNVHIIWSETGYQLDVLRHVPAIRHLRMGLQGSVPLVGSWENLRFVPGLRYFQASGQHDSQIKLDAEAIRQLSRMPELYLLVCVLPDDLSAEEFAPLGDIPRLAYLNLHCGTLSAEHMQTIGRLERLTSLRIITRSKAVDDEEALKHLLPLTRLRELWLEGVSDAGLSYVGQIKSLAQLTLGGSRANGGSDRQITDDGLRHLENLPALTHFNLRNTTVTSEAWSAYAARHPGVRLDMQPNP